MTQTCRGFGFSGRPDTPQQAQATIDFFKAAGCTVMGGLPTYWRTLNNEAQSNPAWSSVFRSFDIISPWAVGRYGDNAGGIEAWSRLGEAVGLTRDALWSLEQVTPGVRFAVDAYVNFARRAPWQEAVCSSLTEMFAPQIHKDRLATWPQHYPWIDPDGLAYFRSRIPLAQRDVEHGLKVTLAHFTRRDQQERALTILQFKLDILWSMLDSIEKAFPA